MTEEVTMDVARRPFLHAILSLLVMGACLAAPVDIRAQDELQVTPPTVESRSQSSRDGHPTRLYFGMWTTHLKDEVIRLDNNWAVGLTTRGYFVATFRNSFDKRAYAAGLQRSIVTTQDRPIDVSIGYRLGLISGYDERFMRIARDTPVMPLIQPFATAEAGRLGLEVSYTFVVVSAALSFRF
jgi:hypothetical protein